MISPLFHRSVVRRAFQGLPNLSNSVRRVPVRHFRTTFRPFQEKLPAKDQENNDNEKTPDLKPKGTAPAEQGPQGYIPRISYERVSYEYPPSPNVNSAGQERTSSGKIKLPKPVESSAWKRHLPAIAAVAGVLWAAYAYKYFVSGEKTGDDHILEPDQFTTFKITYKEDISPDVQLIELSPRNYEQYRKVLKSKDSLWNGKKMWSVEVRQPEIQVVRRYTPLPIYYMQGGITRMENGKEVKPPPLLKMLGTDEDEGRFVLMVKKYDDGEVSRWLHRLPIGTLVDIRGPYQSYQFPYSPIDKEWEPRPVMEDLPSRMAPERFPEDHAVFIPSNKSEKTQENKQGFWSNLISGGKQFHEGKYMIVTPEKKQIPLPENIAFFAGGTGIAPILQSLLSKNPPRGFVDVYFSVKSRKEIPFPRFLLFLEKTGRAKFHYFIDEENKFLTSKDIPKPVPLQYKGYSNQKLAKEMEQQKLLQDTMEAIKREREGQPPKKLEIEHPISDSIENPETVKASVETPEAESDSQLTVEPPNVPNPRLQYHSVLDQVADRKKNKSSLSLGPSLAVVCGPPGYVQYLTGRKIGLAGPQKLIPIKGLLGENGWTNLNTVIME